MELQLFLMPTITFSFLDIFASWSENFHGFRNGCSLPVWCFVCDSKTKDQLHYFFFFPFFHFVPLPALRSRKHVIWNVKGVKVMIETGREGKKVSGITGWSGSQSLRMLFFTARRPKEQGMGKELVLRGALHSSLHSFFPSISSCLHLKAIYFTRFALEQLT